MRLWTGTVEKGRWQDPGGGNPHMNSLFPGMDPYIEACGLWGDFQNHLIEKISERFASAVSDRYLVRTRERSYVVLVESEGKKSHPFVPDVSVTAPRGR